jgi:hypothetical protein
VPLLIISLEQGIKAKKKQHPVRDTVFLLLKRMLVLVKSFD